jgi:hypothetical protein
MGCRGSFGEVASPQIAQMDDSQHDHRGTDGCHRRPQGQRDVAPVAESQRREPVQRQQVGQDGHGQEQGGGVGQPDGGHREGERVQPELTGDRDHHRGQQHRRRVEAEEDRREAREDDHEQPQQPGAAMTGAGRPVAGNVEDPCGVGDLGHHGDGDQEDQDRTHPDCQVGQGRPQGSVYGTHVSRIHGRPGLAGSVSVVVKRWATTRSRAVAVLVSIPASQTCRATRPRVCLAMCVAPGTRT